MRSSRRTEILILAATLLFGAWLARYPAMYAWMRHTGALSPHGTHTESWMGKPGTILSMIGHPAQMGATGFDRSLGIYHVLIFFPGDSLTPLEGSSLSNDFSGTVSQAWNVWSGEPGHERAIQRALTTRYDGLRQTVKVHDRRYSLADGNLFVVRYDARGGVSVRQLRQTYRDVGSFDAFQALLPGDPAVRDLTHYDAETKPCPRRQASPPRDAAST